LEATRGNREESLKKVLNTVLKELRGPLASVAGLTEMLQSEQHSDQSLLHLNRINTSVSEMTETLDKVNRMLQNEAVTPTLQKRLIKRKDLLKKLEQMQNEVAKHHSTYIDADINIPEEFEMDDLAFIQALKPIFKTAHDLGHSSETLTLKLNQQTDHWFYMKVTLSKAKAAASDELEELFRNKFPEHIDHIYSMDLIDAFGSKLKVTQMASSLDISFFVKGLKVQNEKINSNELPSDFSTQARILIVEDNALNQLVTKLMVESYGCKVDLANNGKQALDMFSPEKYDCVFMDIEMPIMNGIVATAKLREIYGTGFPIIGLSADAMGGDMRKHQSLGFSDYLIKPVKKETLAHKIFYWTNPDLKIDA
jgi:CheY-like chemotaxis protein